uniref:hypothetical protein n=1 Tax=Agathobacter sp. TaxID=2021311 RepID=UPI004056962F
MKKFNTTGICKPNRHYMVDIQKRLEQIKVLVDDGEYFVINRARQYGKTTTLVGLKSFLADDYIVVSLDFQRQMSTRKFEDENMFSLAFTEAFLKKLSTVSMNRFMETKQNHLKTFCERTPHKLDLVILFNYLSEICEASSKPIVLMIDEVDSASNHPVFLDFLAQLRGGYLERDEQATFHSVILAGLYDIKNLKSRLRTEDSHKTNSPWNIAADFDIDMSLPEAGIAGMLEEYESDYHTGMDIAEIAKLLFEYTCGYPFLVSRICKLMDEKISMQLSSKKRAWTKEGFMEALKLLYSEKNTLFDSLTHRIEESEQLETLVSDVLFIGKHMLYNPDNPVIESAKMFGFIKNEQGLVAIANRIFETRLYNMFLSTTESQNSYAYESGAKDKNQFIQNGHLDMEHILRKFVQHYTDVYGDVDGKFVENEGRKLFLLYLRPIINGVGNYYIETQTRDSKRTDIIVDYKGEQFIIELKIWHGEAYNRSGEEQLSEYLDVYGLKKGYMLTFCFNKNKNAGIQRVNFKDKLLVEAIV